MSTQQQYTEVGFDLVGQIMALEAGELDDHEAVDLFAYLISTGVAWHLQGFYGRTANSLIEAGYITPEGEIITYPNE